jgi:glycosyltransferase involved in cell wall biosynthesis
VRKVAWYETIEGSFDGLQDGRLRGWVTRAGSKAEHLGIQVFVNNEFRGLYPADAYRVDLAEAQKGDAGFCAFSVEFHPFEELLSTGASALTVEIWVLGSPARLLGRQTLPGLGAESFDLGRIAALTRAVSRPFRSIFPGKNPASSGFARQPSTPQSAEENALNDVKRPAEDSLEEKLAFGRRVLFAEKKTACSPVRPESGQEAVKQPSELRYRIVGHIDGHYSLSLVNRGIAKALARIRPGAVTILHFHGEPISAPLAQVSADDRAEIAPLLGSWEEPAAPGPPIISICHHYPPITDAKSSALRLFVFFWEETIVPAELVQKFNDNFDGVLVASSFVKGALRGSGCRLPVQVIPMGIDHILGPDEARANDRLGPNDSKGNSKKQLTFLHVSSAFPRKGVDKLLDAFLSEFTAADNVRLLIKTFPNPHNMIHAQVDEAVKRWARAPEVIVNMDYLPDNELRAMYQLSDVVVLPTRGEGFNLPAAEAMALGVPVICTGYGGHMDFCSKATAWPIDYELASAASHVSVEGALWAEPDVADLKRALRRLATALRDETRQGEIRSVTGKAAQRMLHTYRWDNAARQIDRFARRMLAKPGVPERLSVAWVSSFKAICGIAEYSKFLTESLSTENVSLAFYCDIRTGAEGNVYPLFTAGSNSTLTEVFDALDCMWYDAIAIQHQPTIFELGEQTAIRMAALQLRAPVFLFLHSTQFMLDLPVAALEQTVPHLRSLEHIIVHSPGDVNNLKKIGLSENVTLLPHGVLPAGPQATTRNGPRGAQAQWLAYRDSRDLTAAQRNELAANLASGTFWIASFGFLLPHKRTGELVRLLRRLHVKGHANVRLVLLCAALDERSATEAKSLAELAEAEQVGDHLTIVTEFLDERDAVDALSTTDLIAFAYRDTRESASGAVQIALSSGVPVLTTPEPIFDELSGVAHRADGWNVDDLAQAVERLIDNPAKLAQHATAQSEWIDRRAWPRIAEQLHNMMRGAYADRQLS